MPEERRLGKAEHVRYRACKGTFTEPSLSQLAVALRTSFCPSSVRRLQSLATAPDPSPARPYGEVALVITRQAKPAAKP